MSGSFENACVVTRSKTVLFGSKQGEDMDWSDPEGTEQMIAVSMSADSHLWALSASGNISIHDCTGENRNMCKLASICGNKPSKLICWREVYAATNNFKVCLWC